MRLLLITYEFPPKGGPGIQRPLQTARLLDQAGWDVTVLTVADPPTSLVDTVAQASVPPGVAVARAWSLEPTRIMQWLRRLRPGSGDSPRHVRAAGYSGVPRGGVRLIQGFFFPDEKVGWIPFAAREAKRLHAELPFDIILASGPPFTAFKLANKLSRRFGIPWVADVRDPIVGNFVLGPLTPLHAAYLRRFERSVVRRAQRTIVVSKLMHSEMAQRVPSAAGKIVTITNGFDPTLFEGVAPALTESRFTVAHVGTFQRAVNPYVFLQAVRTARTRESLFDSEIRIRFVGARDEQTASMIAETGNSDVVEVIGFVSHARAVVEMRSADTLLLALPNDPSLKPAITGKLPEYLGAQKPVLALIPQGAASDVLDRTGAAEIVAPNDVDGAADALIRLHRAWRAGALPVPDPVVVSEFDRTQLVARLGVLLEHVVRESRS